MDVINLAEDYALPPMEWSAVVDRLEQGLSQAPGTGGPDRHTCWLTTLNVDGSPHVTALAVLWVDGHFWFETGRETRKGRNLARDPRCALSLATHAFDLVVEGRADLVTDPTSVARLAGIWSADWPVEVDASGTALTAPFSAPSAGKPPWFVYRVDATSATTLATVGDGGATRFRF
jgi:Pyridoxamine 5'-phosphate oxidase